MQHDDQNILETNTSSTISALSDHNQITQLPEFNMSQTEKDPAKSTTSRKYRSVGSDTNEPPDEELISKISKINYQPALKPLF